MLLRELVHGLNGTAKVRVSDCLLLCDAANVVVVSPSQSGRRAGGRTVWLRGVLSSRVNQLIVDWVRTGGPGTSPMPASLTRYATAPSQHSAYLPQEVIDDCPPGP
jgi:(2Fe-2S) ferredoxin